MPGMLIVLSLVAISIDTGRQALLITSQTQPSVPSGPTTSYVTMFQIQQNSTDPSPWLVAPGSDKTVWIVTEGSGRHPFSQLLNFTVGSGFERVATLPNSFPSDIVYDNITTDNSRRVWILENDSLVDYNTISKNLTVAATFRGSPWYMTLDHNDHFWITLTNPDQIVEYYPGENPVFHNITNTCVETTYGCGLQGIALDPRDDSLWFAELYVGRIGHMMCNSSTQCSMTDYGPPSGADTLGLIQLTVDRNGLVWFTLHAGNEFGSFNPATGEWRIFPIGYCPDSYVNGCATGLPNAIFLDSRGQVWFSEHIAGRIATIVPNNESDALKHGALVEYNLPTYSETCPRRCVPLTWWMRPGPSDLIWFSAYGLGEIGFVNATVPIPFNVRSSSDVGLVQGESVQIPVTMSFVGDAPHLNMSTSRSDITADPPMLSWSIRQQITPGVIDSSNLTITLSASWSSTLQSRYVAVSGYNGNVTVNTFVKVDVVPSLVAYSTVGVAAVISAFSMISAGLTIVSTLRKRKKSTCHPSGQENDQTSSISMKTSSGARILMSRFKKRSFGSTSISRL
jgi:streptogramin lyase